MRRGIIAVLLWGAFGAVAVHAADGPPRWQDLTPEQREEVWRNFREYQQLPPDRRRFLDRRFDRYRHLTPDERRRLRENYRRYRSLPPAQRQEFNERYRRWKSQERRSPARRSPDGNATQGEKSGKRRR